MISLTLFMTTTRKNWKLLVIFLAVLSMYLTVMAAMYEPDDISFMTDMLKLFPENLMKAMRFSGLITGLTSYLASWLYGLLMLGFPMVYCVILSNRLVAKMVDNSSFAFLLSTPNSRNKIIFTQGLYALLSVAVMFAYVFGLGVLVCEAAFPGQLDISAFFRLNLTTMLVNMAIIMIGFFSSCLFNDTRRSLGVGAGLPIAFLMMNMLGGASPDAEILTKISIYGFFDPMELVENGSGTWVNPAYLGIIVILFAASMLVFNKKRLPL
jgi:ABC-2 type transport system permease protein